jgi:hypothetical protein
MLISAAGNLHHFRFLYTSIFSFFIVSISSMAYRLHFENNVTERFKTYAVGHEENISRIVTINDQL